MENTSHAAHIVRRLVLQNYEAWKGEPREVLQPPKPNPYVDPNFGILVYPDPRGYTVYATAGASAMVQPHIRAESGPEQGVRFEYLMHGSDEDAEAICEILDRVTMYPFQVKTPTDSGSVLPLGTDFQAALGGQIHSLFLTYPYEADPRIYTTTPWGQIQKAGQIIQTLWVIPIYQDEAELILRKGPESFEERCVPGSFRAYDWHRPSVLRKPGRRKPGGRKS